LKYRKYSTPPQGPTTRCSRVSGLLGLETRGLDALTGEKAIDSFSVDAEHATHTYGVEAAVVDQATDRFRMDTQLVGDFTNADETRISPC
jgi:hypothetical protein